MIEGRRRPLSPRRMALGAVVAARNVGASLVRVARKAGLRRRVVTENGRRPVASRRVALVAIISARYVGIPLIGMTG